MNKQNTPEQYKTRNKLKIFFTNKVVEIIYLLKLLQYKNFLSKMPSDISENDVPMVTY